jgi:hypothetical protein
MRWIYVIVAPIEWLMWLFTESFASLFAKAMESKGLRSRLQEEPAKVDRTESQV